ncbi:MAG: VacJ family lipoprotein, partial [Rubrivivax sp.]
MKNRFPLAAALASTLALTACTTTDPQSLAQNDPFEPGNREIFAFSIAVDKVTAAPAARFYRAAVPQPARQGVRNALTNLNAPVVLANDVLQGEGEKAVNTFGRFMINSTIGLAGLLDVATDMGIPGHDNDFGITLGKGGVHEGSYLFLPLLGPKPPRDLLGTGVDNAFDPLTYMTWNNHTLYNMIRTGLTIMDKREATLDTVDSIERTSIDFYATTRSLYRQNR